MSLSRGCTADFRSLMGADRAHDPALAGLDLTAAGRSTRSVGTTGMAGTRYPNRCEIVTLLCLTPSDGVI